MNSADARDAVHAEQVPTIRGGFALRRGSVALTAPLRLRANRMARTRVASSLITNRILE